MNKSNYQIAIPVLVILIISSFLLYQKNNESKLRERVVGMTAELDKEKSFDHKRKSFALLLSLRVSQNDLFKFNDHIQVFREDFYTLVSNKKGNIKKEDAFLLEDLASQELKKAGISYADIKIIIEPKQ